MTSRLPQPSLPAPVITVGMLARALVWLAVASSAIVFSEPAPTDALMLGLIALLPLAGLQHYDRRLYGYLALLLTMGAGALLASTQSSDITRSATHSGVSIYLALVSFTLAAFIALRPGDHARLILNAYLAAALLAASAGIAGYFGGVDLFTLFGRATGTFKDPNVFGAFLVPALIYAMHIMLTQRSARCGLPALAALILAVSLFLSFSRGAWLNLMLAAGIYAYLQVVTARSNRLRFRTIALGFGALLTSAVLVMLALQIDAVATLFDTRFEMLQSYDAGPEGRFGGQDKALALLLERPLGIGALQFSALYHHEDVHNVYLSQFLNTGWIGGMAYVVLIIATLAGGLGYVLSNPSPCPLFLVAYASFLGVVVEGAIIDTDHWRHFYLLLALIWGLMAGNSPAHRARI